MKIYEYKQPEIWRVEFAKNRDKYAYLRLTDTSETEISELIHEIAEKIPFNIFTDCRCKLRITARKLKEGGKYGSGKSISFLCHLSPYDFAELVRAEINTANNE